MEGTKCRSSVTSFQRESSDSQSKKQEKRRKREAISLMILFFKSITRIWQTKLMKVISLLLIILLFSLQLELRVKLIQWSISLLSLFSWEFFLLKGSLSSLLFLFLLCKILQTLFNNEKSSTTSWWLLLPNDRYFSFVNVRCRIDLYPVKGCMENTSLSVKKRWMNKK